MPQLAVVDAVRPFNHTTPSPAASELRHLADLSWPRAAPWRSCFGSADKKSTRFIDEASVCLEKTRASPYLLDYCFDAPCGSGLEKKETDTSVERVRGARERQPADWQWEAERSCVLR